MDKMHLEKMSTAELKSRLLGSEGTIANLFQDEGPVTGSMTKSYMAANSERFAIKEILARRGEKVD